MIVRRPSRARILAYVTIPRTSLVHTDVGPKSRRFSLPQTTNNTPLHLTPKKRTSLGHSKDISFFSPATRSHLPHLSSTKSSSLTCTSVRMRNTTNELQVSTSKENATHSLNDSLVDFDWSPMSRNKQPLNSKVSDFNIITGRSIKDSYHHSNRVGPYGNSSDRRSYTFNTECSTDGQGFSLKSPRATSYNELNRAPHLNIRRNSQRSLHTKSISSGSFSSSNPLSQHIGPESLSKYSRHGLEQAGTRISSGRTDNSSERIG